MHALFIAVNRINFHFSRAMHKRLRDKALAIIHDRLSVEVDRLTWILIRSACREVFDLKFTNANTFCFKFSFGIDRAEPLWNRFISQ